MLKRLTLAAVTLAATAPLAQAQEYSAEAVAAAILTGYTERDVTRIAGHSNATNEGFFADLLTNGEDIGEFFLGTRGEAGAAWDGMILPARLNARGQAVVPFAIEAADGSAPLGSNLPGRYISVVLTLDGTSDTTWGFEDINFIDPSAYATMQDPS